MHFLVTGHTGFKGAWLILMLRALGHRVSGLALDPLERSLFVRTNLDRQLLCDGRLDIRHGSKVHEFIGKSSPDVVIHMAAQPLVRPSYENPRETFEVNVMGTLNVLEAIRATPSIRSAVVVTTDKVYRNVHSADGYTESDPLDGHDPYSASKAMADILTSSWARSFAGCPIGIARAGNVIGGGDISKDRLLPDLMNAFRQGRSAEVRSPKSVRPWQHVLDCLHGYIKLAEHLLRGHVVVDAWNFGPKLGSFATVGDLADLARTNWGADAAWRIVRNDGPHEAAVLSLDSTKARRDLGWSDVLTLDESIGWTVDWTKRVVRGEDPSEVTNEQIRWFIDRTKC